MVGEGRKADAQPRNKLPVDYRIAWISTRRGFEAADHFAENLMGRYLLADMIADKENQMHEVKSAHLVAIEAPPVAKPLFEHELIALIRKIRALGPEVLLVIQPSIRKRSTRCLWAHR